MSSITSIIGVPLGYIMRWIYEFVGNYGLAIILFTIITKLILSPISFKQQKNQAKMQLVNPKLKRLREKYKDNPQKMQEEQMRLYSEENINPMASCLPSLVTMLLLWGVLGVVYKPMTYIMQFDSDTISAAKEIAAEYNTSLDSSANNLRQELLIMAQVIEHTEVFETAMADIDSSFVERVVEFNDTFTVLGANLSETPSYKISENSSIILFLIPLLSGLVQLFLTFYMQHMQKKRNPDMVNMGGANTVLYMMPLFSVWLAFSVPAGVGFYWLCSSFFSVIQSMLLYAYFNDKRVARIGEKERAKAKNRRPGMMEKMLEQQRIMMEQQGQSNIPSNRTTYSDSDASLKFSKHEIEEYNNSVIRQARQRMAEKYGD